VIEDLVMAGFLPFATVLLVGGSAGRVVVSIVLAALVVVTILTVAARYGPAISRAVFSDSDEALLFGILAVLLLTAGATEALNVSAAVGAFLAGIVFSGPAADRARSLLVPLRSVFAGTFFLFFGFEVDPGTIRRRPGRAGAGDRRCRERRSARGGSRRVVRHRPSRAASGRGWRSSRGASSRS
jgi:CPA2 family monovalent cation:H+ antiporter-2